GELELARWLYKQGQQDESLRLVRESIEISERLCAEFADVPSYPAGLASGLTQLSSQLAQKQPAEAHRAIERARQPALPLVDGFPNYRIYIETWGSAAAACPVFDQASASDSQVEQAVNEMFERFEAEFKRQPKNRMLREEFCRQCVRQSASFFRLGRHPIQA